MYALRSTSALAKMRKNPFAHGLRAILSSRRTGIRALTSYIHTGTDLFFVVVALSLADAIL